MENATAWIEQPFSKTGSERWLKGSYAQLDEPDINDPAHSGLLQDLGLASILGSDKGKYFEFLLAGKLKLQSFEPLNIGDSLAVEIEVAGTPEPVKTLAVVVGQAPPIQEGMFVSALRFLSVQQNRVAKAA